jgi:hypothetical protein
MEAKPWYRSKTIWGGVVMALCYSAGAGGVQITAEEQSRAVDMLSAAGELAGLIMVVIGRFMAAGKLK